MRDPRHARQSARASGLNPRGGVLNSSFLETKEKLPDQAIEQRKRTVAAACAVVLATWICLLSHLGALGLLGPDEPRYGWIARAMAQTGDWVTPRLYGTPWFEKPVLYYWTAAVGFLLHFSEEWAARLPSAVAALAAALSIGWVAWKFEGAGLEQANHSGRFCPWSPALLAPLIFGTSVAAIGFARAAAPDMLFAASITLAMAAAAIVLRDAGALRVAADPNAAATANRKTNPAPLLLFGAFVGLAALAKGPAGIVLAGGAVVIWALATRRWAAALRLLHPYAIAAFCAVALPWYALCAVHNPTFLRVFILQHNFERYLTPMFHHPQPFWFFIPITLLAILPWTVLLIPTARDALRLWREKGWHDSPAFFFACWVLFPIVFFSFSDSKLPSYILPSIPALALIVGITLARVIEEESALSTGVFVLLGLTWIGLAAGGLFWLRQLSKPALNSADSRVTAANVAALARGPILACVVLAAAAGIAIAALSNSRRRATIWISLLLVCLLVEIAGKAILPDLDPYYSARPVGTMLRRDLYPQRLFIYRLPRAWQYGLDFYLGRDLREWSPDDLNAALVLTTPGGLANLRRAGYTQGALNEPYETIVLVPIPVRPQTGEKPRAR
jgi:4-amino-4-deoxy-L-arabinose transferase-like glycosyltransferase